MSHIIKPQNPILARNSITEEIIACYPFERGGDKLRDISGRNNHGTLTNFTATPWVMTPYGWGLDFDGDNDFVSIPDKDEFSITPSGISIEVLLNTDTIDTTTLDGIVTKDDGTNREWQLSMNYTTPGGILFVAFGTSGIADRYSSANLTVGQWYHIVVTYNGLLGNDIHIYINGILRDGTYDNFGGGKTGYPNTIQPVEIGRRGISTYIFDGKIDKVCIWNKVLLAREATILYANPNIIYYRPKLFNYGKVITVEDYGNMFLPMAA